MVQLSAIILQKKSSLFWAFFSVSDFVSCNEVNLYKIGVINLYISLTVHHDINQFVITNLMHICFIS
jgi:hypothetical protein